MRAFDRCNRNDDGVSPDDFVAALKTSVFDAAVDSTAAVLRDGPPGRKPGERSVALHEWFSRLPLHDQQLVLEVARDAAHSVLFGVLCVLDGVRAVADGSDSRLELSAVDGHGTTTVLNPAGGDLHDRLNSLVHPPSEAWPPPRG